MESGSGEKVEEFVVLHQEPSPSETISPRVARPYIQALNSISQEAPEEEAGRPADEEDLDEEPEVKGQVETSQMEELAAVMEQVPLRYTRGRTDWIFTCSLF